MSMPSATKPIIGTNIKATRMGIPADVV